MDAGSAETNRDGDTGSTRWRSAGSVFRCQASSLLACALTVGAWWLTVPLPSGSPALSRTALPAGLLVWLLVSGPAGALSDRLDKTRLLQRLTLAGLGVSLLTLLALCLASATLLSVTATASIAICAAIRPPGAALLAERTRPDRLPATAARWIAGAVVVRSVTPLLGGCVLLLMILLDLPPGRTLAQILIGIGIGIVILAGLAWSRSRTLPPGRPMPDAGPWRGIVAEATVSPLRQLGGGGRLAPALAHGWFWAVTTALLPISSGRTTGFWFPTVDPMLGAAGLLVGLWIARFLCGSRIVLLLPGIGSLLIGLSLLDLAHGLHRAPPSILHLGADDALAGFGAGLMAVPTLAAVLAGALPARRGITIAGLNIVSTLGVALAVLAMQVPASPHAALLGFAVACLAIGMVMIARLTPNPAGDLVWLLFRLAYRVELRGAEHLPARGTPAIVTPNHVSWLDASLLYAVMDRPVFAIDGAVSRLWWVRPFLRVVEAVPVDAAHPLSMRRLIGLMRSGRPAVIFPEGRITSTGSMMRVQDGAAMAADKSGARIVPARIEGLEATPFSRLTNAQVRRRLFPRVRLTVLPPRRLAVRDDLTGRRRREAAGRALQDLMSDMLVDSTDTGLTLFEAVARASRIHGMGRLAVQDPVRGSLSYRKLLAGAAVLGAKLAPHATPERRIGLMLPNANAAAASILGLASAGIVPVVLNPRAGLAALEAAITASGFTTLVTSRRLVEKARLEPVMAALAARVAILHLEDLPVGRTDRLRGLLRGRRPLVAGIDPDGPAVVLMTSGTSGTPKGVVLSHRNILANIAQVAAVMEFGPADRILNVLPVFHAFGLTAGTMLPLVHGVPVFLYPSPLDYRTIPAVASAYGATALFGTNSFLAGYARTAHPTDFRTVRLVVAGAEPVTAWTRRIWNERFGLRILEGYGVTEGAPVLAVNTPLSNRDGTVGRFLPGLCTQLVPVEGVEQAGRLLVSGPNVMLGYLRTDAPGVLQPPPGGWHDTGDIVSVSTVDGHVTIRGRAARFAKVGGEMVSLALVERIAAEFWPDAVSVAVALADPRKGERIVLITDRADATRSAFLVQARLAHLPDIALPAELRVVSALPLLGSGKPDVMEATRLAIAGALGERVG